MDDFSIGGVKEDRFIGIIGCDEQALDATAYAYAEPCGVGNVVKFVASDFAEGDSGAG